MVFGEEIVIDGGLMIEILTGCITESEHPVIPVIINLTR